MLNEAREPVIEAVMAQRHEGRRWPVPAVVRAVSIATATRVSAKGIQKAAVLTREAGSRGPLIMGANRARAKPPLGSPSLCCNCSTSTLNNRARRRRAY